MLANDRCWHFLVASDSADWYGRVAAKVEYQNKPSWQELPAGFRISGDILGEKLSARLN